MTPYVLHERPALETPVLVVCLLGWIDAGPAAPPRWRRSRAQGGQRRRRHVRPRHVHRLPGPAADDADPRRRERAAGVARDQAAGRPATPTATTCCCSPATSPTRPGTRFVDAATHARRRARRHEDGRARRLPVRRAAHPAVAAVDDGVLAGAGRRRCRSAATRSTCPPASQAALEQRFAALGLPAVGLWAQVPHYVSDVPVPGGVGGPARRPRPRSTGIRLDAEPLARGGGHPPPAARRAGGRRTPSTSTMVHQLEHAYDEEARRRPAARPRRRPALGRRAGRRAGALPARPGPLSRLSAGKLAVRRPVGLRSHHEGRRGHRIRPARTRRPRQGSARRRATRASGRPRPATIRSSRCCWPPSTPTTIELGTAIAVAFARNPMTAGQHRLRPAGVLEGPLHARPRQPDQAAHHQALLDAVEPPGAADARADPGHAGHLGLLEQRHQARLPGRLLHPHADDAVLQPRARTPTATRRSSSPAWAS